MSFRDPISDCLTRIRNGLMRGKEHVHVPHSKLKFELINLLKNEGYLKGCEKIDIGGKLNIQVDLKYYNNLPAIKNIKRISKPSLRKYSSSSQLDLVKNGLGAYIVSTNQGLMTDHQAREKNIGGEILCEVF